MVVPENLYSHNGDCSLIDSILNNSIIHVTLRAVKTIEKEIDVHILTFTQVIRITKAKSVIIKLQLVKLKVITKYFFIFSRLLILPVIIQLLIKSISDIKKPTIIIYKVETSKQHAILAFSINALL